MNQYCILKNGEWLIDPLKINADRKYNSLWTKTPHGVLIFDDKNQGEIYLAQNIDVLGNEAKVTPFLIRNFNTETLIAGNIISNCGKAGIRTEGVDNLTISENKITNTNKGIEVTLKGLFANPSIVNNEIHDIKEEGIHIMKDPYLALDIPKEIKAKDLYDLFEKLDSSNQNEYEKVAKESVISQIDQYTSVIERVIGFSKEYGPVLLATFGPYLNNLM